MEEKKQVAWNASQGLIFELGNRRTQANTAFVSGDIKKAFNTLISIKHSVMQSFDPEERKSLKDIEDKFDKISIYLNESAKNSWNKKTKQGYFLAYKLAKKIYADYNELLMDLLEEYSYLIAEKTDASKMKF